MPSVSVWRELLEDARWSPSPHNIQPWRVRVLSESDAELLYEPGRLLPDTDPSGRFMTVGFGIFVETLAVASLARGWKLTHDYAGTPLSSEGKDPARFCMLHLEKTSESPTLDPSLIRMRRTSRLPYDGKPVKEEVLKELTAVGREFGHDVSFSSDDAFVRWVLKLNRDTMFFDMSEAPSRDEVSGWIRTTDAEARRTKDGLWSKCMGFPGWLMRLFFRQNWIMELPVIKQVIGAVYLRSMRGTRTVGWVQGRFATVSDGFEAGRMLARLWLTMTKHGVYLHPFGSIITNPKAHERLRARFGADEREKSLWLIVRLGGSQTPPESLRLSVDDILL